MAPSFWEKTSFFSPSDIVIAGSGFVGLWSAYYLKKYHPRLRITVVERNFIPTGASTRNAGFACFGSVTELIKDIQSLGEDKMLELVEMRFKGLSRIRKTFSKKEIDYANVGGYEIFTENGTTSRKHLDNQVKWLNNRLAHVLGQKKSFSFADKKIAEFGFNDVAHIIQNDLEGYLHPGKLCQLLIQKVQGMGVNILGSTEITHFESGSPGVILTTSQNIQLKAEQLLICTNAFAKQLLPDLDVLPARGQVLMTAPVPSLKIKGTFHYDEGFYYFRNVGNRLLLGGARNLAIEEESSTELTTTDLIQQTLESFISRHLLPNTPFEVTDRWSGIMGMGSEKMPIVKKISANVYCAVKMSGMGVALAPVAACTVGGMMRG